MTSETSERQATRSERWLWLLHCIAFGVAISIVASFLVALFIELSLRFLPTFLWIVLPVAATIGIAMRQISGLNPQIGSQQYSTIRAAWVSVTIGISLGLIAAGLTGIDKISSGNVLLPGDKYQATIGFQFGATLVTIVAAGVFEELGMRGFIQFRLARHWHAHICEAVAGLVFVALHFLRFHVTGLFLFTCLLALICGRAAAITQTTLWPTCIHVCSNLAVVAMVWLGRS